MSLTNVDATVTCDCGHKFTKPLRQLQMNARCTCPRCGARFVVDTKIVSSKLAELKKAITNFNRR